MMNDEGRTMNQSDRRLHRSSFVVRHLILFSLILACAAPERGATKAPSRIVTLAPNVTEMVYFLDAGQRIVGTDDFSDFPPTARTKAKVGGVNPSIERIVALRPDLAIASASSAHPALVRALANVHVPLLIVRTDRAHDIADSLAIVGARLGIADAAPRAQRLRDALGREHRVREKQPRVLFLAYTQPIYVAGHDTFTSDILDLCGAENAAKTTGWPQYSAEALIANPPDVVIYPSKSVARDAVVALFAKAPKAPRIIAVDENTFSRPGPRIVEAAHQLNEILDSWQKR
jgi:ABC-type hemin transport system substrate-binding protein